MSPTEIAQTLLEARPGRRDPREFLIRSGVIKGFTQIGGDWGSPWAFGGIWYCPKTRDLVYFPGITSGEFEYKEIDPYGKKVTSAMTPEDLARIEQGRAGMDPDNLGDWERVEDEVRQEIADRLEAERKFTVYRTVVDDKPDSWWKVDDIIHSLGKDKRWWNKLPMEWKTMLAAEYHGWHEFDHYPDECTLAELSKYLGKQL